MDTPCWEWTGAKFKPGYGRINMRGVFKYAHRIGWLIQTGEEPVYIRHKCDNKKCVRADHLINNTDYSEGDRLNKADAVERGRYPGTPGERHNSAKLTEKDIKEIRRRSELGETNVKLGKDYGVTDTTISYIVRRKTWRHVA